MYHTKQLSFDNTLDKLGPRNLQHINAEYPKLQDTGTMSNKCEQWCRQPGHISNISVDKDLPYGCNSKIVF